MRRLALLCVTIALLAVVPGAGAAIVVQRGMGGATLGMTHAQVRAKLGSPLRVRRGTNEFGPWRELVYRDFRVSMQGLRTVTAFTTVSPRERTARGIGVGSTEAQVRARVAGVRCRTEFGTRHCFVGRFLPGRRITDFTIRRGRVSRVTLGFVID